MSLPFQLNGNSLVIFINFYICLSLLEDVILPWGGKPESLIDKFGIGKIITRMNKVFALGLDGASFSLISQWIQEGKLPHFKRLIQEGAYGMLRTVPNQRSAAAWSTFSTGRNPGKHGIYDFYHRCHGTYEIRFTNATNRNGATFWEILSDQGKSVGIINVPMTYPAEKLNGYLIAGLDAPGIESRRFSCPEELIQEIQKKVGGYILEPGITGLMIGGRYDEAIEMAQRSIHLKTRTIQYLMERYPSDCMVAVYRELDPVQHCFWKFMDQSHPGSQKTSQKYINVVQNTYKMMDDVLGWLIETLDEDTTLIVLSDHGFGCRQHGTGCLNDFLKEMGLLHYVEKNEKIGEKFIQKAYHLVEKNLSRKTKEKLLRIIPGIRDRVQSKLFFSKIDWSKTFAYSDNTMATIWINLVGREPGGIVKEGPEYEELISKIKDSFLTNCLEAVTGEKVVDAVYRRNEIYHGQRAIDAPDFLIQWKENIHISGVKYKSDGKPISPAYPTQEFQFISGDHRNDGIIFMRGKGIKKGHQLHDTTIQDIAPTILYQMDSLPDKDMDGSILLDAFEPAYRDTHLVKNPIYQNSGEELIEVQTYSEQEETAIRERLRGLGYLE